MNNFGEKVNFIRSIAELLREAFKWSKFEINFNRYFYLYLSPRQLEVIEADIRTLVKEIMGMPREVAG